ncbi:MAG: hypothetical protein KKA65_05015 [Nanoarchaeota archaeon]|nr:hypothetical protein [Nanoarchaeota archaeon]MBU4241921.1 hypothetical protein [Nanoarchaeota archaeon]MBU4351976.1 hypothetical protein [Nanoarchaeota archaeon]MBU4456836.1 hypothetical protein [Nanoarchaeota archaeon]MCG2719866.1 hypothetical protein [Nanoarchaeota archaeon]
MSLFGKKKEAEVKDELPPLRFPELPSQKQANMEISQNEQMAIKQAVAPAQTVAQTLPERTEALSIPIQDEEKPLFVKIDKYREVISTMNQIKSKLKDADEILAELNKIKQQEDNEIETWHSDLETIKGKLMAIDRALFEL